MPPPPGHLRVVVRYRRGAETPLLNGADVDVTGAGLQTTGGIGQPPGEVTFRNLAPGTYSVRVTRNCTTTGSASGTVVSNTTTTVEVIVSALGRIKVNVTDAGVTSTPNSLRARVRLHSPLDVRDTNAAGQVEFGSFPPGNYTATASRYAYCSGTQSVTLAVTEPCDIATINIALRRVTVTIQINNQGNANYDLVQVKCAVPNHRHRVPCRIKLDCPVEQDVRVLLTNPDGALRFPNDADTTKALHLPSSGAWAAFEISGETVTALRGARINALLDDASGPQLGTKQVTVFGFSPASIALTTPGTYTIGGGFYTCFGTPACAFSATASVQPAGVDCTAPQLSNLQVAIMQESMSYTETAVFGNPVPRWDPATPSGATASEQQNMTRTTTYAASVSLPVNDGMSGAYPLYDAPGSTSGVGGAAVAPPTGCPGGGPATASDTPSSPIVAQLRLPLISAGARIGDVTWSFVKITRNERFRTFCVIFNRASNQFCALRESNWGINIDSSLPNQTASANASDRPVSTPPATGVQANNAASASTDARSGSSLTWSKP